jgi:ADP-ribosylglycohydrolase
MMRSVDDQSLRTLVRSLVSDGVIKLRWRPRLDVAPLAMPADLNLADKIEGMLLGLAIGDALGNTTESMNPSARHARDGWIDHYLPNYHANGRSVGLPSDDSQLAFWTIEHLLQYGELDPQRLGELFAQPGRQIFGGGQATAHALSNIRRGMPWTRSGSPQAGNGALMRIAPVLLAHLRHPTPALWTDTLASAHVTHDDELSNSSCIALVDLLWKLIGMSASPDAQWWMEQWIEVNDQIGCGTRYAARAGHPPGFVGTICDLLRGHVQPALDKGLDVDAAGEIWHSGAYLLETVPTVLYVRARFGHDPKAAILQAVNGSRDNDTVAAIVGAAVGALHGASAWPDEWVNKLLGRTREDDDGQVFRLMMAAGKKFGYGVTPRLVMLAGLSTGSEPRD